MLVFSSSNKDMGITPRFCAKLRVENILSRLSETKPRGLVKTASFGTSDMSDQVLRVFAKALSDMKIKTEIDLGELFKRIFAASSEKPASREDVIKIASKEIKDSHYQLDLSKEAVEKGGIKMFMVSAYLRDAYLGRYLIKRNYFYLADNERRANVVFDEIDSKVKEIKSKYYNDNLEVKAMTSEIFKFLQDIKSDIDIPEDDIGTTVKRS